MGLRQVLPVQIKDIFSSVVHAFGGRFLRGGGSGLNDGFGRKVYVGEGYKGGSRIDRKLAAVGVFKSQTVGGVALDHLISLILPSEI